MIDTQRRLRLTIQFDPVKVAMSGIRVYLEDRAFVPACFLPEFFIQVNAYTVTDLDFDHDFFLRPHQKSTMPTVMLIPPLSVHCGSPVM